MCKRTLSFAILLLATVAVFGQTVPVPAALKEIVLEDGHTLTTPVKSFDLIAAIGATNETMFRLCPIAGCGTPLLSVSAAGNVGIGTESPGTPLDVRGKVSVFPSGLSDGDSILNITVPTTTGSVLAVRAVGSTTNQISLAVQQNGDGDAITGGTVLGTGDALTVWQINGGQRWIMGLDNSSSDSLHIADGVDLSTDVRLTIDTVGNVGVNNIAPTATLHVKGRVAGDDLFLAETFSGSVALVAEDGGNVGIGATPASKFDVNLSTNETSCITTTTGAVCDFGKLATAPTTCTAGDVYTDTSPAKCWCSAVNTWSVIVGIACT